MQVILLDNIPSLGQIGEEVKVRAGFARNWLLPQGKALPASEQNRVVFEERRARLEQEIIKRLSSAEQRAVKLREIATITIEARTDDNGKLYGSVSLSAIAEALNKLDFVVEKREILIAAPLNSLGVHTVQLRLHADLTENLEIAILAAK